MNASQFNGPQFDGIQSFVPETFEMVFGPDPRRGTAVKTGPDHLRGTAIRKSTNT